MSRWFGRRRRKPPTPPSALDVLVAELVAAGGEGYGWAAVIRSEGEPAVRRLPARSAAAVKRTSFWLRNDPIIAARAKYDKATTGADWSQIPEEPVRRLMAERKRQELIARANGRRNAALKRLDERRNEQTLAYVRGRKGQPK